MHNIKTIHVHPQNYTSSFYSIILQSLQQETYTIFVVRSNRFLSSFASTPSSSVSARTAKEMTEWRSPITWAQGCWWDTFSFLDHVSFVTIGYIFSYFSFIIVEICHWSSRCKNIEVKRIHLKTEATWLMTSLSRWTTTVLCGCFTSNHAVHLSVRLVACDNCCRNRGDGNRTLKKNENMMRLG